LGGFDQQKKKELLGEPKSKWGGAGGEGVTDSGGKGFCPPLCPPQHETRSGKKNTDLGKKTRKTKKKKKRVGKTETVKKKTKEKKKTTTRG